MNPKVAIVIVNWNKRDYVINLLNSLKDIDYDNYEIIVVDNASTDDSVTEIKKRFHHITLLENKENLGGTGGFNTGMRYALGNTDCKYIWLLDNDAEVERDTLIELVKAMEADAAIGIVGSRIICKETNVTVECGSYILRDTIGVMPLYRNLRVIPSHKSIEVDYVAVCSALVRADVLSIVGLMDKRFFLFWDDMDWGLSFKKNGYKVVAVPTSIVYHPSFTERDRGLYTNYYYGIRNALLTYAKNMSVIKLIKQFYNYFRILFEGVLFLYLCGEGHIVQIISFALKDFYKKRWGSFLNWHKTIIKNADNDVSKKRELKSLIDRDSKVLIIASNSTYDTIIELSKNLDSITHNITLFIQDDRVEIYRDHFKKIISFNSLKSHSLIYNIRTYMNLRSFHFEAAISPTFNPFLTVAKKKLIYSFNNEFLDVTHKLNLFTVTLSTFIGELFALILTPLFIFKSLNINKK